MGASSTVCHAAAEKEVAKMIKYSPECRDFGWECVPLAVATYGGWREKAIHTFQCTSRRLGVGTTSSKAILKQEMYGRLSLTLMRSNARATFARSSWREVLSVLFTFLFNKGPFQSACKSTIRDNS